MYYANLYFNCITVNYLLIYINFFMHKARKNAKKEGPGTYQFVHSRTFRSSKNPFLLTGCLPSEEDHVFVTEFSFQISSTYSLIVRSEENLPAQAVFIIAMRAHPL